MQATYDINTIIIIITFLVILVAASYFINKYKDLLRSRLKVNQSLNIISNSIIGNGNRITIFQVRNISYLVVSNRSNISNIVTLPANLEEYKKISGEKK